MMLIAFTKMSRDICGLEAGKAVLYGSMKKVGSLNIIGTTPQTPTVCFRTVLSMFLKIKTGTCGLVRMKVPVVLTGQPESSLITNIIPIILAVWEITPSVAFSKIVQAD